MRLLPRGMRVRSRFSLRTLFVVTIACGALSGWLGTRWMDCRERREAISRVYWRGGLVAFEGRVLARDSVDSVQIAEVDPRWRVLLVRLGSKAKPGSDEDLVDLLAIPEVTSVELYGEGFSNLGLRYLAQLPKLSSLGLNKTSITLSSLAASRQLSQLEHLTLVDTSDSELEGVTGLTELRHLQISSSPRFTDAGLANIAALTSLERLDIYSTPIDGSGFGHLPAMPKLCEVQLTRTHVNNAAIPYLQGICTLRRLNIQQTLIDDTGVKLLNDALPRCAITYQTPSGMVTTIGGERTGQTKRTEKGSELFN